MKYRFFIIMGVILFGFSELFVPDAFAYIDPGTGSLVIQIIVGALVGVGITVKIYWYKLKEKFIRSSKKND
jgi:hypothetical protein